MINVTNLNFGFNNELIIKDLSFTIDDGDFIAIIGSNGTGKSTLIKCLVGINQVGHKMIQIDDKCITCFTDYHKIGYVPQVKNKPAELPITVEEIFKLISKDKSKIQRLSKQLNIENLLKSNVNDLSGGQKQRVNIAKALLLDIKYLILDEPTTGLDPQAREELNSLLKNIHDTGVTLIVVSHYFEDVKDNVSAVLDMETNSFERINNA